MKIYKVLLVIASSILSITNCYEIKVQENFSCDSDNPRRYYLLNLPLWCDNGEVCNLNNLRGNTFCTKNDGECSGMFTCNGENVLFTDIEFECPEYNECNIGFKWPCKPCVPKICTNDMFTCSEDLSQVVINNIEPFNCDQGYICNKDKICPGLPCIKIEDNGQSTPSPIGTTTLKSEECLDNGSGNVDCNDGFGRTRPCRNGPKGSGVYYRCIDNIIWFNRETISCSTLSQDPLCKNEDNICCLN